MVELILNNLYSVKYPESLYKLRLQQPSCEDLLSIYFTIFSFCQKNYKVKGLSDVWHG